MQKIPTLFLRDEVGKRAFARNEVNEEAAWVLDGRSVATEKFDGSACLIYKGRFYKRHELREGKPKPDGWIHWNMWHPSPTGHGWAPVLDGSADAYHREAFEDGPREDGTYELVGPKVQRNPYGLEKHELWRHGSRVIVDCPTDFDGLRAFLEMNAIEGIVWHRGDGGMAKIKRRDFGILWPVLAKAAAT
jgi:hypothetical protein